MFVTSRWQRNQKMLAIARSLAAGADAATPRRMGAKLAVLAVQVWTEPLGSSVMGVLLAAALAFPSEQIVDLSAGR